MLVVISPAKRLDWSDVAVETTEPAMQEDAVRLVKTARNLTLGDLKGLMGLSDDLAKLNRDRFEAFAAAPAADATRPAMYGFAGDTYTGLEARTLDPDEVRYAQDHLRILSGLYGVLRPLDAIQPYRLEMGSRLKTRRGSNLYHYWRDQISKALNAQAEATGSDTLINCASQEYFGAVDLKALKLRLVTPQFYDMKAGKPKIISFFAKKARGSMARYVVQNRLNDPADILGFDLGGYRHCPELSAPDRPAFLHDERT
ncbi:MULTISPECIES: peroxide stress protein YaaA [unclassified Marinovum]